MTLEILTADNLAPFQHGFFTRRGGISTGIFAGLNCGASSSDQRAAIEVNRTRAAEALGIAPGALVTVYQVHGSAVMQVSEPVDGPRPRADAMVTDRPGMALAVLTADCQPVLFADHQAGVIGAAHAGWRGALAGVLEATVDAMEQLGAKRENVHAAIGPTISQAAYEVGPDFMEDLIADDQANIRFFAGGSGDRMNFDLPAYGLHRLRQHGIGDATWLRQCTYSDPDRYYSYRRSIQAKEADYGRLISAIRM